MGELSAQCCPRFVQTLGSCPSFSRTSALIFPLCGEATVSERRGRSGGPRSTVAPLRPPFHDWLPQILASHRSARANLDNLHSPVFNLKPFQ